MISLASATPGTTDDPRSALRSGAAVGAPPRRQLSDAPLRTSSHSGTAPSAIELECNAASAASAASTTSAATPPSHRTTQHRVRSPRMATARPRTLRQAGSAARRSGRREESMGPRLWGGGEQEEGARARVIWRKPSSRPSVTLP